MTIFGWSCRELWSTVHLGGIALENGTFPNCSTLASVRALVVDLLFQVLSPHPLKSIGRLPLALEKWEEGNMHCERGRKGLCWHEHELRQGTGHHSWRNGIYLLRKVFTLGYLPRSWGLMLAEVLAPPSDPPSLSDQISSSCSTEDSALSSPQAPACSFAWTLISWMVTPAFCFPAPTVHYLPPFLEDPAISSHLLLTRNDTGKKPWSCRHAPKDLHGSII